MVAEASEAGTLTWKDVGAQTFARFPRGDGTTAVPLNAAQRVALDALVESRAGLRAEVRELQENPPGDPSEATRARLREHGIAVFARRCIFDAQPPITTQQLASVEEQCGMKVPDDLAELWSVCLGGELFYDLNGRYEGVDVPVALSFREIFYNQSPFYRDLDGWIAHENELAHDVALEKGNAPPSKANYLPFGGFEYLDRAYVRLAPDDYASVWYWKKALPPNWKRPLKVDSVTCIASSMRQFFSCLHIDVHAVVDAYGSVSSVLERLEPLKAADPELAAEVRALYLSAHACPARSPS